MKLAVLSGKGGTGKTFISVNLAAAAKNATYMDCDVEEPNGRLFLKPTKVKSASVDTMLPSFDETRCKGCRQCVDFCRFNALAFIKGKPKVFETICHSCGGCLLVCPHHAITEKWHPVGRIERGSHEGITVITGILNPGEASAVPVIHAVLDDTSAHEGHVVIDCPPGSGCPVLESVSASDYCVLVAEPTAFGLHNLQMVVELLMLLQKPYGVVINKIEATYAPLEDYCAQNGIRVLSRIPYSKKLAQINTAAEVAYEQDEESRKRFQALLQDIEAEVRT